MRKDEEFKVFIQQTNSKIKNGKGMLIFVDKILELTKKTYEHDLNVSVIVVSFISKLFSRQGAIFNAFLMKWMAIVRTETELCDQYIFCTCLYNGHRNECYFSLTTGNQK